MAADDLAKYLHRRIRELNLTRQQVADRAGVTRKAVHDLLNARYKNPSIPTLKGLAKALKDDPRKVTGLVYGEREAQLLADLRSKYERDYSRFVGDITIPDKSTVVVGEVFEKVWEIANAGETVWENRRLVCRDEDIAVIRKIDGVVIAEDRLQLLPLQREVPIPRVQPGDSVRLSVTFRAPAYPCTTISYWKMVDASGELCFPNLLGLNCQVIVQAPSSKVGGDACPA